MNPRRSFALPFDTDPECVGRARHCIRSMMDGEVDSFVHDAMSVTSEIVTNAIVHGGPPRAIEATFDTMAGHLHVTVNDGSRLLPCITRGRPVGDGGLGMQIVSSLSSSWGAVAGRPGKTVWFTLERPDP